MEGHCPASKDAAPPCVLLVVEALGQKPAYERAGIPITCPGIAGSNLPPSTQKHSHRNGPPCEWDKMADACPVSCSRRRRAMADTPVVDEAFEAEEAYHGAFDGSVESLGSHDTPLKGRKLQKNCG